MSSGSGIPSNSLEPYKTGCGGMSQNVVPLALKYTMVGYKFYQYSLGAYRWSVMECAVLQGTTAVNDIMF